MSRLHEALSQAGVRMRTVDDAPQQSEAALDDFPTGPETTPEAARDHSAAPSVAAAAPSDPTPVSAPSLVERLVVHPDADEFAIEQYRRVAAVLHQAQVDRGLRVVMVASAQPGEGKTLTAANLGLTLSESYGRRVLLIDADLRRPSLSDMFHLPNGSGLAESLKAPRDRPLHLTKVSNALTLLSGGHPDPDPMSGLSSGRMQQIIEQAADGFDWVVIDTPPVALLSDARLLAAMVDAAVLVIDAGTTPCALVQRAIDSIGRDKIIGVVLNRIDRKAINENAYYQYYRYTDEGGGRAARRSLVSAALSRVSGEAP